MTQMPPDFLGRLQQLFSPLRDGMLHLRKIIAHKITAGELFTDTISEQNSASGVTVDGVKLKDSEPYCDVINEKTAAAGVTIDGVKLKDSEPYCDVINEKTATAGVTVDGVLLKDSEVTTDIINEKTGATGVTIDSVLLKDGVVAIGDVAFDDATSDPLAVGDAAADGTENSVARKDHGHATGGTAGGELAGTYPNPTVDATHSGSAHHTQAHGIADHTGHANWKALYTDASGDEQEIALGANGTVLTGTSATGAPAFEAADEHSHTNDHAQVHGPTDHTEGTAWRLVYQDASGDEQEIALGADGEVLTSTGAEAAPAFEALPAAGAHAILDGSTHSDSVADAVTRGSLIYGNSTPKWDELTIGAANTVLASDSTDAGWTNTPTVELLYATSVSTDNIVEKTAAAGVTVDGLLIKDEYIEFDEIVAPGAGAANKLRLYALDQGAGVSALQFVNAAGTVTSLAARMRRMNMSLTAASVYAAGWSDPGWRDAVSTDDVRFGCVVPEDWVSGTDITLHILLLQTVTAGSPTAVLRSSISTLQDQDTTAWNVENAANMNAALTQNILEEQSRTIAAASIASGDNISWNIRRLGADAGDTVNAGMSATATAWIEYTAFF